MKPCFLLLALGLGLAATRAHAQEYVYMLSAGEMRRMIGAAARDGQHRGGHVAAQPRAEFRVGIGVVAQLPRDGIGRLPRFLKHARAQCVLLPRTRPAA